MTLKRTFDQLRILDSRRGSGAILFQRPRANYLLYTAGQPSNCLKILCPAPSRDFIVGGSVGVKKKGYQRRFSSAVSLEEFETLPLIAQVLQATRQHQFSSLRLDRSTSASHILITARWPSRQPLPEKSRFLSPKQEGIDRRFVVGGRIGESEIVWSGGYWFKGINLKTLLAG